MSSIQKIESNIYDAYTKVFYPLDTVDKIVGVAIIILMTTCLILTIVNASMIVPLSVKVVSDAIGYIGCGATMALMLKNIRIDVSAKQRFCIYYDEMDKLGFIKKEDEPNTLDANSKV